MVSPRMNKSEITAFFMVGRMVGVVFLVFFNLPPSSSEAIPYDAYGVRFFTKFVSKNTKIQSL